MSNVVSAAEVLFDVVVNDEGQYSIWASGKHLPQGWRAVGKQGTKESCLDYINDVWVDMRPISLQRSMAATSN